MYNYTYVHLYHIYWFNSTLQYCFHKSKYICPKQGKLETILGIFKSILNVRYSRMEEESVGQQ